MRNRNKRLNVIREILSSTKIICQEELLNILQSKGYELTQATLSRDLKIMKVIKTPDTNGSYAYKLPADTQIYEQQLPFLKTNAVTADFSGNIVVLHTRAGYASSLAYRIDEEADDVIIGTVAGEDTVVCVIREDITRKRVLESLSKIVPSLKN